MNENCIRADRMMEKIREKLDYQRYLTPVNFHEENERFLAAYEAGERYEPQYRYEPFREEVSGALAELAAVPLDESGIGRLLEQEREALADEVEMYRSIGTPAFTEWAIRVHGRPDPKYYEWALELSAPEEALPDREKTLTAEALRETFAERIGAYGFDWKIEVRPNMTSKVSVDPERREILINGKKTFSENDRVRLRAHEIDTHVLRAENGRKRGLAIFANGTAGSLIHEEGLALYNEARRNVMDQEMLRLYAGRFLSCLFLEESSFYESFDRLVKRNFSRDQAMYIVARVKRGLSDTGQGGGFIKDYVYFQGYYEVAEAMAREPERYEQLYYGGISLENLDVLKEEIRRAQEAGEICVPAVCRG